MFHLTVRNKSKGKKILQRSSIMKLPASLPISAYREGCYAQKKPEGIPNK